VGNNERWRRVVNLSIQRVPVEEAGHLFFAEEWQQLLEDASEQRALLTGIRREKRRAANEHRGREVTMRRGHRTYR
jgi:hypothetical protein